MACVKVKFLSTACTSQNDSIFHVTTLFLFRIPVVFPDSHLCSIDLSAAYFLVCKIIKQDLLSLREGLIQWSPEV